MQEVGRRHSLAETYCAQVLIAVRSMSGMYMVARSRILSAVFAEVQYGVTPTLPRVYAC